MKLLISVIACLLLAGCASSVRNVKKVQYYEPTKANEKFCKQPSQGDTGHGPIKSIEYEVRQMKNYNLNIYNKAIGL